MNLIKNLKENYLDILMGLGLAVVFAILADVIERVAITEDGAIWMTNLIAFLRGIAFFYAAAMVSWIGLATIWPELNAFMVSSEYDEGLKELSNSEKLTMLVIVVSTLFIGACLCFSV